MNKTLQTRALSYPGLWTSSLKTLYEQEHRNVRRFMTKNTVAQSWGLWFFSLFCFYFFFLSLFFILSRSLSSCWNIAKLFYEFFFQIIIFFTSKFFLFVMNMFEKCVWCARSTRWVLEGCVGECSASLSSAATLVDMATPLTRSRRWKM